MYCIVTMLLYVSYAALCHVLTCCDASCDNVAPSNVASLYCKLMTRNTIIPHCNTTVTVNRVK